MYIYNFCIFIKWGSALLLSIQLKGDQITLSRFILFVLSSGDGTCFSFFHVSTVYICQQDGLKFFVIFFGLGKQFGILAILQRSSQVYFRKSEVIIARQISAAKASFKASSQNTASFQKFFGWWVKSNQKLVKDGRKKTFSSHISTG